MQPRFCAWYQKLEKCPLLPFCRDLHAIKCRTPDCYNSVRSGAFRCRSCHSRRKLVQASVPVEQKIQTPRKCREADCVRPTLNVKYPYCQPCYRRWHQKGIPRCGNLLCQSPDIEQGSKWCKICYLIYACPKTATIEETTADVMSWINDPASWVQFEPDPYVPKNAVLPPAIVR